MELITIESQPVEVDVILLGLGITMTPDNAPSYLNGAYFFPGELLGVTQKQLIAAFKAYDPTQSLKDAAKRKVMATVEVYRATITNNASSAEQASWARKADAAARHSQGVATSSDTLLAETEAAARGQNETAADLFDKWASRDMNFVKALGLLDGLKSAALKAIDDAPADQIDKVLTDMATQAEQAMTSLSK